MKGTTSTSIYMFCLNASLSFFLSGFILSVLGGLGIEERLVCSVVEFPAISPCLKKYKIQ